MFHVYMYVRATSTLSPVHERVRKRIRYLGRLPE